MASEEFLENNLVRSTPYSLGRTLFISQTQEQSDRWVWLVKTQLDMSAVSAHPNPVRLPAWGGVLLRGGCNTNCRCFHRLETLDAGTSIEGDRASPS